MIGVTSSSSGALPSETDWKERQQSSKGYQLLDVNHWDKQVVQELNISREH